MSKLGPFKVEGQYIRNNKEMCNTKTKQYNAQYSNNINKHKMNDKLFDNIQEDDITDITIDEDDIMTAIGNIDPNSTTGPEGVSAKFLRETERKREKKENEK